MGLDYVELILAVEEAFQVPISDQEASDLTTVGDLHQLLRSKLNPAESKACLTSTAFYRIRRGIIEDLGIPRRSIRPATPLAQILPHKKRREDWSRLQQRMRLVLPPLQYSTPSLCALLLGGFLLVMALGLYARLSRDSLVGLSLVGILGGLILVKLATPLAREFPAKTQTVGDLARDVLALNHSALRKQTGSNTNADLWEALRRLIHIQTGTPLDQITPQARIVDDLKID